MSAPTLYGLDNSDVTGAEHFGKNQFTCSFPMSLCCYMRDKGIRPVYIDLCDDFSVRCTDDLVSFHDIFCADRDSSGTRFLFRHLFGPFSRYVKGDLGKIDVVVSQAGDVKRPLSVSLTVIPDLTTLGEHTELAWGSELVLRPLATSHAVLSIYDGLINHESELCRRTAEQFIGFSKKIHNWEDPREIGGAQDEIMDLVRGLLRRHVQSQRPFLVQSIWKTKGQNVVLDDKCLDVFVWTDFALFRAIADLAASGTSNGKLLSRAYRECARFTRCMSDLFAAGEVDVNEIYTKMSYGRQTDKACALNGAETRKYMYHKRRNSPLVDRSALRQLILGDGYWFLRPERRLDATIRFTCGDLFDPGDQ